MSTLATLYAAMRQIGRPVEGRPSPVLRRLLEARTDTPAARRPLSNATVRRVHATAIPAPSSAVKRRKIAAHLGEHVELPSGRADRALVWTAHRVEEWRRTGQRPAAAMVWTRSRLARSSTTWPPMTSTPCGTSSPRGLRRSEAVGLPWTD